MRTPLPRLAISAIVNAGPVTIIGWLISEPIICGGIADRIQILSLKMRRTWILLSQDSSSLDYNLLGNRSTNVTNWAESDRKTSCTVRRRSMMVGRVTALGLGVPSLLDARII